MATKKVATKRVSKRVRQAAESAAAEAHSRAEAIRNGGMERVDARIAGDPNEGLRKAILEDVLSALQGAGVIKPAAAEPPSFTPSPAALKMQEQILVLIGQRTAVQTKISDARARARHWEAEVASQTDFLRMIEGEVQYRIQIIEQMGGGVPKLAHFSEVAAYPARDIATFASAPQPTAADLEEKRRAEENFRQREAFYQQRQGAGAAAPAPSAEPVFTGIPMPGVMDGRWGSIPAPAEYRPPQDGQYQSESAEDFRDEARRSM